MRPNGWHLPSDEEWKILEGEVDSTFNYPDSIWNTQGWRGTDAGNNLREAGDAYWSSSNTGATNGCSFTVLPGGFRSGHKKNFQGRFNRAHFWTSTKHNHTHSCLRNLSYEVSYVSRGATPDHGGYSVRCLSNN